MDFAAARFNMVENQIRPNGINDPLVVRALAKTPREAFLPKAMHAVAYVDETLPLGSGRFLISPLVLARLLQSAGIKASDVVLTIGDATGWASAVVSMLASTVVCLECEADPAARAGAALSGLGRDNVAVVRAPLADGYPAQGPYDVILLIPPPSAANWPMAGACSESSKAVPGADGWCGWFGPVIPSAGGRFSTRRHHTCQDFNPGMGSNSNRNSP